MKTDLYKCPMPGCRRKFKRPHTDIKRCDIRCVCGCKMIFEKECHETSGTETTVGTSRPVEVI